MTSSVRQSLTEEHLDDPITRHMRVDFSRLRADQTIGEALAEIRHSQPQGRIIYFYVVDDQNRLQGVVPTRRLLLSSLDARVDDIMVRHVVTIPDTATVMDACEFFTMHRFLAFPVVDSDRRVLGIVDLELYTDELSELVTNQRSDDLFQLIGVHLATVKASPLAAFQNRFPWLLCNVAGGLLAAFLTGLFEAELKQAVSLALFIPVVLALAESVTIQSVSLALQALHGQRPTLEAILRKLRTEVSTGLLLGTASGLLVALAALLWLGEPTVVLCVLGGIAGGVACAAVIGVALPNLLHLFQRDPQVAAGPIALAAADMITLVTYFSLARWLLP